MSQTLFPLLKPADYPHRALVVTVPLPGTASHPQLPIVTFAENLPSGYVVLTDAGGVDPSTLLGPALAQLATIQRDLVVLPDGVAIHGGQDLAAELLLDATFLKQVAMKLKTSELWVCVPHRVAFYAVSTHATESARRTFAALVRTELERGPRLGHAPVSDLAFRVSEGKIVEAVPSASLAPSSSGSTGGAPEGLNWTAGLIGAFLGGVLGMGLGIGAITLFDGALGPDADSAVVFGLAGLLGAASLVLGLRWR
jgi:hypothetical protein